MAMDAATLLRAIFAPRPGATFNVGGQEGAVGPARPSLAQTAGTTLQRAAAAGQAALGTDTTPVSTTPTPSTATAGARDDAQGQGGGLVALLKQILSQSGGQTNGFMPGNKDSNASRMLATMFPGQTRNFGGNAGMGGNGSPNWGGGNPGWAGHGGGYRGDSTSGGSLYG